MQFIHDKLRRCNDSHSNAFALHLPAVDFHILLLVCVFGSPSTPDTMTWHAAMDDDTANIWRAAEEIKTNVCRMMMMMLNDNICSNKRSRKRVKEEKEIKKWHEIYGFTTAYVHSRLWHKSFDALLSRTIQGNSMHLCNENECIWSEFCECNKYSSRCHRLSFIYEMWNDEFASAGHDVPFKWKCARKCVWNMNAN